MDLCQEASGHDRGDEEESLLFSLVVQICLRTISMGFLRPRLKRRHMHRQPRQGSGHSLSLTRDPTQLEAVGSKLSRQFAMIMKLSNFNTLVLICTALDDRDCSCLAPTHV